MVGILGRVGGPVDLSDVEPRVLVAFVEGILREYEESAEQLDKMYAHARAGLSSGAPAEPQSRAAQIEAFLQAAAE